MGNLLAPKKKPKDVLLYMRDLDFPVPESIEDEY
jgi:hypothetical protein